MDGVVDGLVKTVLSLPKEDMGSVIDGLSRDRAARQAMIRVLIEPLTEPESDEVLGSRSRPDQPARPQPTPREWGQETRERYVADLQQAGIAISLLRGVWATTRNGQRIAIACANQKNGAWFLGLPEKDLLKGDITAILLCYNFNLGLLLDFVVPPQKIREVAPKLSKSHGQLKFHIRGVGTRYVLTVPGGSVLDLSDYRSGTSALES